MDTSSQMDQQVPTPSLYQHRRDESLNLPSNVAYSDLDKHEIRLLRRIRDRHLEFELHRVDIRDKPKYVALSYAWGTKKSRLPILIDGQEFIHTENLYQALERLADHPDTDSWWIDAVSINQRNVGERNQQVRLMKDIYERATKVFVWLGHPSDETEARLAMEMMDWLFNRYMVVRADIQRTEPDSYVNDKDTAFFLRFLGTMLRESSWNKHVWDTTPGSPAAGAWQGIGAFFSQKWWTRTWVIQEATVRLDTLQKADNGEFDLDVSVCFFYGPYTTNWGKIAVCAGLRQELESKIQKWD
jgi:Heterokaryon incompatibility protein (HET)